MDLAVVILKRYSEYIIVYLCSYESTYHDNPIQKILNIKLTLAVRFVT